MLPNDPSLKLNDPLLFQLAALDLDIVCHYPGSVVGYDCSFLIGNNADWSFRWLIALANFQSSDVNTYTIENLLTTHTWGQKRPLSSKTPLICDSSNIATTIWVMGSLMESTLTSTDPAVKMHGVAITPITQGTGDEVKCLLARLKALVELIVYYFISYRSIQ